MKDKSDVETHLRVHPPERPEAARDLKEEDEMIRQNRRHLLARSISKSAPSWPSVLDVPVGHNDWARTSGRLADQANDNPRPCPLENQYSLQEVEDHWSISVSTLYREIARGRLIAAKIGDQWRISESNLADYLKSREKPPRLPGRERRRA